MESFGGTWEDRIMDEERKLVLKVLSHETHRCRSGIECTASASICVTQMEASRAIGVNTRMLLQKSIKLNVLHVLHLKNISIRSTLG